MPKQIMSLEERAEQLVKVSKQFSKDYPFTAKWINHLAVTLMLPRVTAGEVLDDFKDIIDTFKIENTGSDVNANYRAKCYDELENIFLGMIKTRGSETSFKTFESLLPALEIGNQALKNIAEVYLALVASKDLDEKRRYFGLCFMYLIYIEGRYDEDIRILFTIKKTKEGSKIDYESIQEKPLWDFKSELPAVFFEGCNLRIRNSIAHARFWFDENKKQMCFQDRATKNQPAFKEKLSISEFGIKYYGKIDGLCRLRAYYMLLLGVRDLIFATRPFGQTTLRSK